MTNRRTNLGLAIIIVGSALLCVAATNLPSPLDLLTVSNTLAIHTNVPVHVLPVVQESQDQLSQYLVMIIPLVVPMLIAFLKTKLPTVPSWALPLLAPVLGSLADVVLQASGVHTGGALKGALLGSAGVGLRELANQVSQAMPKTPPPPPAAVPPPAIPAVAIAPKQP
jgi:hypothetical protein